MYLHANNSQNILSGLKIIAVFTNLRTDGHGDYRALLLIVLYLNNRKK